MILSDKSDLIISAKNKYSNGKILVSIDGQENFYVTNGAKIKLSLYKKNLKLIKNCSRSYFETLKTKLHWSV